MPSLSATTTAFLQRIKDDLNLGTDLGSSVRGAAQNYLRAQDMATALELLQDALDTVALTAVSGTTTSVTDGASTFIADRQVGNIVTFSGNVTAALTDVSAVILDNTTTTLSFAALTDAPASGDTYTIAGGFLDEAISELRDGKSLADSPASNVYGNSRVVQEALLQILARMQVAADATVVLDTDDTDTITVTLSGALAGSAGNDVSVEVVDPGPAINIPLSSSFDAVTKILTVILDTDGAGALDDTANTTTLVAAEIDTNAGFAAPDTGTHSVTATELGRFFCTGGASLGDHKRVVQADTLLGAGATSVVGIDLDTDDDGALDTFSRLLIDNRGVPFRIDQLKGRTITVSGEEVRRIVRNDEDSCLVSRRYASNPGAVAYTIHEPDQADQPHLSVDTHPGAQPGMNRVLAELIDQAQTTLAATTLPT